MNHTYRVISSIEELDTLIGYCKDTKTVSFDFETTGHEVHEDEFKPTILGVSFQPGSSYIIPLAHYESPFEKWETLFHRFMKAIVWDPSIDLYVFNALFEIRILLKYGYVPRGRVFDVMLMKYVLNEERPNDLKSLVEYMLPDWGGYDLPGQPGKNASRESIVNFWSNADMDSLAPYCAKDTDAALRLGIHFHNKLLAHDLYHFIRNFYTPLIFILSRTILEGLHIDRDYLYYAEDMFYNKLESLKKEMVSIPAIQDFCDDYIAHRVRVYIQELEYELDNATLSPRQIENKENKIALLKKGIPSTKKEEALFEPVNFGSVNQLKDLLYTSEYGLELPILDRTDKGAPSTAEDTLIKLVPLDDSGFVSTLLDLRADSTVYTTFMKGVKEEKLTTKDRIHPSYLLHGAVTGRTSSRNPNIQNIPRTCISPDQEILTSQGWRRVGDFIPDQVGILPIEGIGIFTHKGVYQKALFGVNKGREEMFQIELEDGSTVTCTREHRMLTPLGWRSLKEILDNNLTILSYED